jgi:hypothetical protein
MENMAMSSEVVYCIDADTVIAVGTLLVSCPPFGNAPSLELGENDCSILHDNRGC